MLPSNHEFREMQWSESQTSLRGINEFLGILSTFIVYWIKCGMRSKSDAMQVEEKADFSLGCQ